MELRSERPDDQGAVADVVTAAFGAHGRTVAALADTLRPSLTDELGLSLVAEHEGQIVGHVMFSTSRLDAPRRLVPVAVLSPVSVRPDWQRRGVGSALIRHGIDAMTARSVPVVFLEGDPNYYQRFGFRPGRELGYRRPSLRIPEPGFQARQLPAHEPWMTGTLVYSAAFWDHDCVGLRQPEA
jgi:putative acetyltransferase